MGVSGSRKEELLRPGDVAGPAATTTTPIMAATGFKVEDTTDLVVELPGRNFELGRNYAGNSMYLHQGAFGLFTMGGWTLTTDTTVFAALGEVKAPYAGSDQEGDQWKRIGMPVLIPSPIRNSVAFQNYMQYKPEGVWHDNNIAGLPLPGSTLAERRTFLPVGGGSTRMIADTYHGRHPDAHVFATTGAHVTLPVWRVVEPGGGTSIFFRIRDTPNGFDSAITTDALPFAVPGKLWKQIDEYGNEWNFEYTRYAVQGGSVPRLTAVYLHGENADSSRAVVNFGWTQGTWTIPTAGGQPREAGAGIWHVSSVWVSRPFQVGQAAAQRYVSDTVEYYYRGDVETRIRATLNSGNSDFLSWLGTDNDLVQVVHRTGTHQPMAVNGSWSDSGWPHVQVSQYRYTFVTDGSNPTIQIKGVFSPEQIEAMAREHLVIPVQGGTAESLGDRGRALHGAAQSAAMFQSEDAAWGLLTLGDRDLLARPNDTASAIAVWRMTHKWVTYYGHPRFVPVISGDPSLNTGLDWLGQVESEYLSPGEGGHTLRQKYTYPDSVDNANDKYPVTRTAQVDAGNGQYAKFAVGYNLRNSVVHIKESTRQSDAAPSDNELDDAVWRNRRLTTHRSETRDLFTLSMEDQPPGSEGPTSVRWIINAVPFTVAELVEDIPPDAEYPTRSWLTLYDFDQQNRPRLTVDPAAITGNVTLDRVRLSNWKEVLKDGTDRARLGSISGVTYTDMLDYSTPFAQAISQMPAGTDAEKRGVIYYHNYPATSRIKKRYAGDMNSSATTRLLKRSTYRDEYVNPQGSFKSAPSQTDPDSDMRPDLLIGEWLSTDGADGNNDDDSSGTKQQTSYSYGLRTPAPTGLGFSPTKSVVVTRERELPAENGPSSSAGVVTKAWVDDAGRLKSRLKPDGVGESYEYDSLTGKVTATHMGVGLDSSGIATLSSNTLSTHSACDVSGNTLASTSADGVVTSFDYTIEAVPGDGGGSTEPFPLLCVSQFPHELGTGRWSGPVAREWYNAQLRMLRSGSFEPVAIARESATGVVTSFTLGQEFSRSEADYSRSGQPVRTRDWAFASTGGVFPASVPSDNVSTTSTVYDGDGNAVKSIDVGSTVTTSTYDARGRLIQTKRTVVGGPDPKLIEERFYDGEEGGHSSQGDGLLTMVSSYPQETGSPRSVRHWYDARNRLVLAAPVATGENGTAAIGPYALTAFDNLDRPVLSATLSSNSDILSNLSLFTALPTTTGPTLESYLVASANAVGVQKTRYSQRGLVCRTLTLADRVSDPAEARWLVTDHWFDDLGREAAVTAANSPSVKRAYDLHGRVTTEVKAVDPANVGFADATDVTHGFTLERVRNTYLSGHTLLGLVEASSRTHSSIPESGALGNGLAEDAAERVVTYTGFAYDTAARRIGTVKYGTNGSTDEFTSASASVPSLISFPADDQSTAWAPAGMMAARSIYNSRGQAEVSSVRIDATHWRNTRSYVDSLGRGFAVVESYRESGAQPLAFAWSTAHQRWSVSWPGDSDADENRVTTKAFDTMGHVVRHVAHLRGSGGVESVQSTGYRYHREPTLDDPSGSHTRSPLPSNNFLYEIDYASTAGGAATVGEPSSQPYDRLRMSYNLLGEQTAITDQNGTIRQFLRDTVGRVVADRVVQFGTVTGPQAEQHVSDAAVDDAVSQIVTEYDAFGRTSAVISMRNPNAGAAYVLEANPDPTPTASLRGDALTRNTVEYEYDYLGATTVLRQSADGPSQGVAGGAGGAVREVRYGFELTDSTHPYVAHRAFRRAASLTYPDVTAAGTGDETTLATGYVGPVDSVIGRVSKLTLTDPDGSRQIAAYQRLGLSTYAVTDLTAINIQLDRTVRADGSRQFGGWHLGEGRYGGWDRYGRLVRNSWVRYGYGPSGQASGADSRAPLWQETSSYDQLSRKLSRDETRAVYAYPDQDWDLGYDRLDRLTRGERGRRGGGGGSTLAVAKEGSKRWTLDEVGNWTQIESYDDTHTNYNTETRSHTATNEAATVSGLTRRYDAAGSLRRVSVDSAGATPRRVLIYDAWNRLVRHEVLSAPDTWDVSRYQYNGLHWRTKERRQLGAGGDGSDTTRWQYYSLGWQLLLEAVGTEQELTSGAIGPADPRARLEQQVWGLRGTDDAILRRWKDPPAGGGTDNPIDQSPGAGDSTTGWQGYFQLTDGSFSVIAHADYVSGAIRQRMSYDAYGTLTVLSPLDFNGDGQVTTEDEGQFETAFAAQDLTADVNGDGTVDGADKEWYGQRWNEWIRTGWTPDEVRIGYGGYVRDPVTGLMLARNRWYDSVAGRWITRDPAGYVDGLDLYLYARGSPFSFGDPTGLAGNPFTWAWGLVKDWGYATGQAFGATGGMDSKELAQTMKSLDDQAQPNRIEAPFQKLDKLPDQTRITLEDGYNAAGNETATQYFDRAIGMANEGAHGNVVGFGAAFAGQILGAGMRIVGEFAGEAAGEAGAGARGAGAAGAEGEAAGDGPRVGYYKDLSGKLPDGSQANHLNQNAAYEGTIAKDAGLSVEMKGDAITDVGSPHYNFHKTMEDFWEPYRDGNSMFGKTPTNGQYGEALKRSLRAGGFNEGQAQNLSEGAAAQRKACGLKEDAPVPRIPSRLNQKKPK